MRDPDVTECLELVLELCETIEDRIARYGITAQTIKEDDSHLDLVLMPIFQIGELVGSKTYYDALQTYYPSEMWSQAYGLRNRIAHGYGKLSPDIIWNTVETNIPELEALCKTWLDD